MTNKQAIIIAAPVLAMFLATYSNHIREVPQCTEPYLLSLGAAFGEPLVFAFFILYGYLARNISD